MSSKRNLRRVHVQSGATDRMTRPIDGIFTVFIDEDDLVDMMARAAENKSKRCCQGALIVEYQPANKATADFMINGEAFGKLMPGFQRHRGLQAV